MWLEEGCRTLHDVQSFRGVRNPARSQNARFSLAHRLAATFPGAGNASRKPETTVTEATTAGRGDNCGEVHNGRGCVGPRGLNRPPCSTTSSGGKACLLDADHRACGWVSIAEAVQSGQRSWLMSPTTFSPSTATAPTASKSRRRGCGPARAIVTPDAPPAIVQPSVPRAQAAAGPRGWARPETGTTAHRQAA